jgi:hypothetical protein
MFHANSNIMKSTISTEINMVQNLTKKHAVLSVGYLPQDLVSWCEIQQIHIQFIGGGISAWLGNQLDISCTLCNIFLL